MTDTTTYDAEMDLLTAQEEADWQRFLHVYKVKNSFPVLKKINLSWRFWLSLSGGLGAIALSAFRTGPQFYALAFSQGHDDLIAKGEAISAVLGVNFTILALSTIIAYKTQKISDFSMTWGLRVAVIISALAGLGQAFHGLNITALQGFFDWSLALAIGAGVTALEYFGGDMIGVELVRYELELKANLQLFEDLKEKWFAGARQQFPQWVLRKNNKRSAPANAPQQTNNKRPVRSSTRANERPANGHSEQLITNYLDATFANEQRVLGVSELARLIAANEHPEFTSEQVEEFVRRKKGYISQITTNWLASRQQQTQQEQPV